MKDLILVIQCKRGSKAAFCRLYEKYRDSLLIIAIAISRDHALAEDAVQDTFVSFAERIEQFELAGSLKGYLAICVSNRTRDLLRERSQQRMTIQKPDERSSAESDPSRIMAWNEELQELGDAWAQLPFEQRQVMALRIYSRMRFRTIANHLGISVNTVKGRYRYALEKLRVAFRGKDNT